MIVLLVDAMIKIIVNKIVVKGSSLQQNLDSNEFWIVEISTLCLHLTFQKSPHSQEPHMRATLLMWLYIKNILKLITSEFLVIPLYYENVWGWVHWRGGKTS